MTCASSSRAPASIAAPARLLGVLRGFAHHLGLPARALRWDGVKPATGIQAAARQYLKLDTAWKAEVVSDKAPAQ